MYKNSDSAFSAPHRMATFFVFAAAAIVAGFAGFVADTPWCARYGVSPLVIGMLLGLVMASMLRPRLPAPAEPGLAFVSKGLLRLALIFYGFRISIQQIVEVGLAGFVISLAMVFSTMALGMWIGRRWLGMDRDVVLLTTAGSAVCGAAAVVATESMLRSPAAKGAVAIGTVVLFGTVAMLLLPLAFKAGWIDLDESGFGIYVGATVHEVAQVVAAGTTVSIAATDTAVIVKMTRVLMLAPMLLLVAVLLIRVARDVNADSAKGRSWAPPWFVLGFIGVVIVSSFDIVPPDIVRGILEIDSFILTMAMAALGFDTRLQQVRDAGIKPLFLAALLFAWLALGGYGITTVVTNSLA